MTRTRMYQRVDTFVREDGTVITQQEASVHDPDSYVRAEAMKALALSAGSVAQAQLTGIAAVRQIEEQRRREIESRG